MQEHKCDAAIVGSGPNGLSAAIVLAQKGHSVVVYEAKQTVGGGMRSAELTLPGFIHDVCSAIHPLGISSPFFRTLPLEKHDLEWIHPSAPLAHPFDDGTAAILERSIDDTCETLGSDADAYKKLMKPLVEDWNILAPDILSPLHFPKHPIKMVRFGIQGIRSAHGLAKSVFKGPKARALFAGLAAHSVMPLDWTLTASFGLILGALGHAVGWPIARGGSQKIADALASFFCSLEGKIQLDRNIESIDTLPSSKVVMLDVSPRQLLALAGDHFPSGYQRQLENYRYGPGVFKIDWALSHPIPWNAKECFRSGTVHIGGTLEEIVESEQAIWKGVHPEKPFIILAQQSLFDSSRAPEGQHTAWAYCHVPSGSVFDMTERIESQIERFASGFRRNILARSTRTAIEMERYNPNYIGGDITGGVQDIYQIFKRPTSFFAPYSTPKKNLFLCSSSTPPGGGVHGMCGYHAAQLVNRALCIT